MRLKGKLAVLLAAFTLLFVLVNWLIHSFVIMPGFLAVEQTQAANSAQRTVTALNREIAALDDLCADWAAWDDAYRFIVDHNPDFSHSNLVEETYTNNHLNLLLFYDLAGNYVAGNTYDLESGEYFAFPDFPLGRLHNQSPLAGKLPARPTIKGILNTSRGPLLFSAQAIRRSDDSGPPRGFLLMGAFLDSRKIAALGQQTVQDVTITPAAQLAGAEAEIFRHLGPANNFLQLLPDGQKMRAYTAFADLTGSPALLIKVTSHRDIFIHGRQTMRLSLALTILAGFLVLALLLYLTHTKILRPIEILLGQIATIRRQGTLQPFTVTNGAAEIDVVVEEFNTLIAQLADKEQEQTCAHREREKLIGELQAALAKVKQLKGLLPICASCKKIRDDRGYWNQLEVYIRDHSEAVFTHGICDDCAKKLYPEFYQAEATD